VTETSVTYEHKPTKSLTVQSRTVDGQKFVAGFAQHILPTGFHKIRHYGWMTSNSKIKLEEIRMLIWFSLGWIYWMASGQTRQAKPVNPPPFRCTVCGGTMQVSMVLHIPIPLHFLQHRLAFLDSS
jgi:hypothetical protein